MEKMSLQISSVSTQSKIHQKCSEDNETLDILDAQQFDQLQHTKFRSRNNTIQFSQAETNKTIQSSVNTSIFKQNYVYNHKFTRKVRPTNSKILVHKLKQSNSVQRKQLQKKYSLVLEESSKTQIPQDNSQKLYENSNNHRRFLRQKKGKSIFASQQLNWAAVEQTRVSKQTIISQQELAAQVKRNQRVRRSLLTAVPFICQTQQLDCQLFLDCPQVVKSLPYLLVILELFVMIVLMFPSSKV